MTRKDVARGASPGPTWVRSWDTDVPVGRSSAELESLLRRYGAKGYTVSSDYSNGTLVIGFTVPRTWAIANAETVEIRMAIGFHETLRRLEGMQLFQKKRDRMSYDKRKTWPLEQAERVAWRQLIMLVEAGLNAAAAGIQTVDEAFFAHQVIRLGSGVHRAIDVVREAQKALPPGRIP